MIAQSKSPSPIENKEKPVIITVKSRQSIESKQPSTFRGIASFKVEVEAEAEVEVESELYIELMLRVLGRQLCADG